MDEGDGQDEKWRDYLSEKHLLATDA